MTIAAFAVDLADARFAARGVGDREHRVGVGVIDEPGRAGSAWRIVSTEGTGDDARSMCVTSSFTMSGSDSRSSRASLSTWSSRTGEKPAGSMVSRSQPLPLT